MSRVRLTADLPGSGGRLEPNAEDFRVSEILAYAPSDEGEHLYILIEKTGLTTLEALARVLEALGTIKPGERLPKEVGFAGMKDKRAIARQWLSVPWPIARGPMPALAIDGVTVLECHRHRHKLRRGHARANRFQIRLRDAPAGALERAQAALERLRLLGVPSFYGPQRFGRDGDNAERALAFVKKEAPVPRDRRLRDLMISALQSAVFNRILALRIERGLYGKALLGDVMQKHETGGIFTVEDPAVEQPRVDALAISATGVLPGKKARPTLHDALAIEEEAMSELGVSHELLARFADGTRRALRQPLDPDCAVRAVEDGLELEVTLSSGCYATVLLDEIVKPEGQLFDRDAE